MCCPAVPAQPLTTLPCSTNLGQRACFHPQSNTQSCDMQHSMLCFGRWRLEQVTIANNAAGSISGAPRRLRRLPSHSKGFQEGLGEAPRRLPGGCRIDFRSSLETATSVPGCQIDFRRFQEAVKLISGDFRRPPNRFQQISGRH